MPPPGNGRIAPAKPALEHDWSRRYEETMQAVERHRFTPDVSFDGGELDCGNGLLLLIRQHMDPMEPGQLLEFRSTEISVDEDFPAWCRMTGNELVSFVRHGRERSFLVSKGQFVEPARSGRRSTVSASPTGPPAVSVVIPSTLPAPAPAL